MKYVNWTILAIVVGLAFIIGASPNNNPPKGPRVIELNERTTISLNMPIDGATALQVQQELISKSLKLRANDEIYLVLNSPGGSISDGEKIIETALGLPQKVHTISLFSASMSFIISQYLDKRYIVESGVMMSHRASAGGLQGQVPGNLITRTLGLLTHVMDIEKHVAERAGMTLPDYDKAIADEMWIRGHDAVDAKFADELIRVRCDRTLSGSADPIMYDLGGFSAKVVWHKCPLITQPLSAAMDEKASFDVRKAAEALLYDKEEFVRVYSK